MGETTKGLYINIFWYIKLGFDLYTLWINEENVEAVGNKDQRAVGVKFPMALLLFKVHYKVGKNINNVL